MTTINDLPPEMLKIIIIYAHGTFKDKYNMMLISRIFCALAAELPAPRVDEPDICDDLDAVIWMKGLAFAHARKLLSKFIAETAARMNILDVPGIFIDVRPYKHRAEDSIKIMFHFPNTRSLTIHGKKISYKQTSKHLSPSDNMIEFASTLSEYMNKLYKHMGAEALMTNDVGTIRIA
jgi:hypothetical protein